jgi:microcystin degradation protein MlrC
MGDNVGGGSPGDGTFILEALEKSARWKSFVCIFDPEAVAIAAKNGEGKRLVLEVGAKSDTWHGSPCCLEVMIRKIADGIFQEDQPRHGGQVNYNMGKIAIVESENNTTIMLTSLRIAPFSLKQLTTFGIHPQDYDVVVAKGVHAPMAAYESVCRSFIRVNTEGITKADMTSLEYANRRRPLFPFESAEERSGVW